MSDSHKRIYTTDGMAHVAARVERYGDDPCRLTLAEWIDGWASTGALASTEVIGVHQHGAPPQLLAILGLRLPLTYDDFVAIIADSVRAFDKHGYLSGFPRPLPSKTPNPAPTSNTGLSKTKASPKAGGSGENLATKIERDFDGALD